MYESELWSISVLGTGMSDTLEDNQGTLFDQGKRLQKQHNESEDQFHTKPLVF